MTRALRVLHILTVSKSLRFLSGQVAFMRERDVELLFVTSPDEPGDHTIEQFVAAHDVSVYTVSMTRRVSPIEDARALLELIGIIRATRPDVVHVHTPKAGLLGSLAAWLCRHPARIYHMRGLPLLTATGFRRELLTWTERVASQCAHRVVSVSHSLRAIALAHHLTTPDHIVVLAEGSGQGVDALERFNPTRFDAPARQAIREEIDLLQEAGPVVGFVGRFVQDKGVRELIKAWEALSVTYPDAYLLCVGEFEERDALSDAFVERFYALPRMKHLGWREDTPRIYAICDLIVLPTYREGFPNVPMEASAMGLPVVTTRVPGCVDAVMDGLTGKLVPPGDVGALTEAMDAYMRDPNARLADGTRGRARMVESFLPSIIFDEVYALYGELMRRGAGEESGDAP